MFRPRFKMVLTALTGAMVASVAGAQTPAPASVQRSSVEIPTTSGLPEFRDPKTGQIWTPENVGQGPIAKPSPSDLAFDAGALGFVYVGPTDIGQPVV